MKSTVTLFFLLFFVKTFAQVLPPTNGLVAYWPMDEGQGSTVLDATGNGYDGSFSVNSPSWSTTGRIAKCLEMSDNSGRYINISSFAWAPSSFTISWWLNPYSFTNHSIGAGIAWGGFLFQTTTNGGVSVGTDLATRITLGTGTVKLNEWQHFSFTYANGTGKFYRNGILLLTRSGMAASTAWTTFKIGGNTTGSSIHGKVDDIRIYNRDLTEEEVIAVASWPAGPITSIWRAMPVNDQWNNGANWQGGTPGNTTNVIVNACSTCPALIENKKIKRLDLNASSGLHLNAHTLTAESIYFNGTTLYSDGGTIKTPKVVDIRYSTFEKENSNSTSGITIDVAPQGEGEVAGGNIYNVPIHYKWSRSSNLFYVGGSMADTYNEKATFTNYGQGWMSISTQAKGTVFNKEAEFNNLSGRIDVALNGGIIFQEAVVINNDGIYSRFAINAGSSIVFHKPVVVNNLSTILLAYSGNLTFHSSLTLSNTSSGYSGSIGFGENGGVTTLSENATINIASWSLGNLYLKNFKHLNESAITTLTLTKLNFTDPYLSIGPNSSFKGEVNFKAPNINLNGGVFHKKAVIEKIASHMYYTPNNLGGNVFHGETILKNTGGQPWYFGQNAPDIFNGDLIVTHVGGNGTYLAHWQDGNKFKGNLTLTLTAGSTGTIQLGGAAGTSEQTAEIGEKSLIVNASSGHIKIGGFTQRGSITPTILLTGSANLTLSGESIFEAALDVTAPQLFLNGCLFKQPSRFIKTGAGNNNWTGGNVFKSKATFINQATSGTINTGLSFQDMIIEDESIIENYPFY